MLNVSGGLSETEYNNHEWTHYATQNAAEEGMKLLNSGSGIDPDYGKIYVNEEVPFEEIFNGTTFPAYLCDSDSSRTKMSFPYNIAHFIFQVNIIDNSPSLCYNKNDHKISAAKLRYRF